MIVHKSQLTQLFTNRSTPWRVFHDINFASYKGGKFDASKWPLTVNGLLGPVTFRPEGN